MKKCATPDIERMEEEKLLACKTPEEKEKYFVEQKALTDRLSKVLQEFRERRAKEKEK
jgi:hypothetical protein